MYIFIVNPVAGNGRGYKVFKKLNKSDIYQKITSKHYVTEYPGHAEEIAKQIVKTHDHHDVEALIVVGGDGTVHEVLNGLGNSKIPISFIPGGSGNDFGRGCGITGSPLAILNRIVSQKERLTYWTGNYGINQRTKRKLINSIGFGFDAEIARQANFSSYKKILNTVGLGTLSYVFALIHVLFKFKPFRAEIYLDGKKKIIEDCWMVTMANHQYYGGGMKIIPTAKIQPKMIPVLIIHGISKWKILGLFLTVFTGKHVLFKEVELSKVESLIINTECSITYQVDGQTGSCQTGEITKNEQSIQIMGSKFPQ